MYNEIIEVTKKLVAISSINSTTGEKDAAIFIENYLKEIPYFKEHPELVFTQDLRDDELNRKNVFALIKGEKGTSKNTIIIHGHMDTVGVDDYGQLKEYAFDCDKLIKQLENIKSDLSEDVKEDLESGDYLFGRGTLDMKGGVAVFMVVMKYLSERVKEIDGNILFSSNPVEENLHTGIIEALEVFENLKKKESLNYLFTINSDCVSPLYPKDETRYIYTGSIGKVLPCFYVIGKEAHVGQCFEGFEASMVASELVRMINLNPEFCDGKDGEYTAPPSVLKLKDLKPSYNVQTSFSSFVYFNFMVTHRSTTEILNMLKNTADKAMNNVMDIINERYKSYCDLSSIQYTKIKYNTQVLGYNEVYKLAKKVYEYNIDSYIDELTLRLIKEGVDNREISLEITKHLCEIAGIRTPTVVVFFATPYCPHNTINEEVASEKLILEDLKEVLEKYENETDEKFKILKFFACLTDSSYVKIDDDNESIDNLVSNFPNMRKLYNVPMNTIKELNIPSINIGCFGKDPHKWTERVHMPYSFGVLPKVVIEMIEKNLMKLDDCRINKL
ncbi:M20/M25/M40 family metallo-hydrolase [Candidatus Clostridium helianthi]|uniref:M20/M25/M40 family metallo-hydrolase n=1 Tax=Candidatus Clostridium helianthi TaxID=3381660 RepID=A0ABW8SA07_9CLOT